MPYLEEQISLRNWKQMFKSIDYANTGLIATTEILQVLKSSNLGFTSSELEEMIDQVTKRITGEFSMPEFLSLRDVIQSEIDRRKEIQSVFDVIDANGDGYISLKEFKRVMNDLDETLPMNNIQDIFEEIDTNGDGRISSREFTRFILNKK